MANHVNNKTERFSYPIQENQPKMRPVCLKNGSEVKGQYLKIGGQYKNSNYHFLPHF
jgi:hypothetical protein